MLPIIAQLFSLLIAYLAYRKRSVSPGGLAAMIIISTLMVWTANIPFLILLFLMFASSSLLTRFKRSQKSAFNEVIEKKGARDHKQAIANLGIGTFCILLYDFFAHDALLAAAIGSVAAANADSWASEIGGLSKTTPRMITDFRPVDKGISGGVTALGMAGTVAGSFFIAIMSYLSFSVIYRSVTSTFVLMGIPFIAGMAGAIFDSYLGAVFQAAYSLPDSQKIKEYDHGGAVLIKGFRYIDNDMVNLLSTAFGAVVAAAMVLMI